jgi:hypothetical protein
MNMNCPVPTLDQADQAKGSAAPKLICVGTGRDGTVSISCMMQTLLDRTTGGQAMHDYCSREFYQAFSEHMETGKQGFRDEIGQMITECPLDCIVGTGYAPILPLFVDKWGPNTKLVHIKRADREACIASMMKNCEMFPVAYRYYSSAEGATVKRMAAFHFGDMSKSEWDKLPAAAKFGWYYDKTHALIEQHKGLFAECLDVFTEKLDEEPTRRALARIAIGSETVVPPPVHLNAHAIDIAAIPKDQRDHAMWLLGRLDLNSLVTDDVYGLAYFLNNFISWTGYQIRGELPQLGRTRRPDRAETAATLGRARAVLDDAIRVIGDLERLNRERDH